MPPALGPARNAPRTVTSVVMLKEFSSDRKIAGELATLCVFAGSYSLLAWSDT